MKKVVLGVTGCIAAYKACTILRGLQKAGLEVKVVMTQHATELVTPMTFAALSHYDVGVDMFADPNADPIPHIDYATWADVMLIAPCTANVAAKLAQGIADDLLTSTALAMHVPVLVAPAANVHMYEDVATQDNLNTLRSRGIFVVEPDEGYLACGDEGKGRLAEPDDIVAATLDVLGIKRDLEGKQILVTAGPTIEPIDPVRYITNHSSGKTGYALAEAAALRGAQVTLVSGPTVLQAPDGVELVSIQTAKEMLDACKEPFRHADIAIFSAAVLDFAVKQVADHKLKKSTDADALASIHLVENPDIIATLAAEKGSRVVVGYAAETENVIEHAQAKLVAKHADFIVANQVGQKKGFGTDTNHIWLVSESSVEEVPEASKRDLADVILDKALSFIS